jgi:hypothetical protein
MKSPYETHRDCERINKMLKAAGALFANFVFPDKLHVYVDPTSNRRKIKLIVPSGWDIKWCELFPVGDALEKQKKQVTFAPFSVSISYESLKALATPRAVSKFHKPQGGFHSTRRRDKLESEEIGLGIQ